MQRALVIRTYGNPDTAKSIANALVRHVPDIDYAELNRLRAEIGVYKHNNNRRDEYLAKIREAESKYHVEPITGIRAKLWGLLGLAILLRQH